MALIEKDELLKHGEFITMNVEILGHMQSNGVDDLFMYDRDFQPGDTVQHFKGGFYKIVAIGTNTETEEKMVVYQSLKDQRVWIRPYEPNKNPSELIDKLLEDNHGFLIFQEDTIKFLTNICGLSGRYC